MIMSVVGFLSLSSKSLNLRVVLGNPSTCPWCQETWVHMAVLSSVSFTLSLANTVKGKSGLPNGGDPIESHWHHQKLPQRKGRGTAEREWTVLRREARERVVGADAGDGEHSRTGA